jgi:hypothetical protein
MAEVIKLTPKKKFKIPTSIFRTGLRPSLVALKTILSPKATPFLAAAPALILGQPALALKIFGGTALTVGALETSPKLREFVGRKVADPTAAGREVGKIIEDPSRLLPKEEETILQRAGDIAKKAGIGAGVVAAATGVAAAVSPQVRQAITGAVKKVTTRAPKALPAAVLPAATLPTAPPAIVEPLGAAQPTPKPKEKELIAAVPTMPDIINKISFKPEINVKVTNKKQKFINQQILLTQ